MRNKTEIRLNKSDVANFVELLTELDENFKSKVGQKIAFTTTMIARETTEPSTFPFVTGFLRGSYTADNSKAMTKLEASVGSIAEYAPNVELGYGQRPQPYFFPTVDKWEDIFHQQIDKLIQKTLK